MINNNKKIFICATEQSGDNIGANVISDILKINKDIIFEGVGGEKMSPFLNKHFFSLSDFNSMGIIEIILSIKKYIKMINFLASKVKNDNYDMIITVDSPDFNYPLVKKIKKNNFKKKMLHIVAPTVWAWREYRAKNFSDIYDEILLLFYFEKKYFEKFNLKTTFIGHPIYYIKKQEFFYANEYNKIAFLPGSRKSELNKLLPFFNIAYKFLLKDSPNIIIFIPTLPHLKEIVENYVKSWQLKIIISSNLKEIEENYLTTNVALVCSGTASLEIAKRNIPQLVIYKFNFLTELIVKRLVKIKYANILNIIEKKIIIPEITNSNLKKNIFKKDFERFFHDKKLHLNQIKEINNILKKVNTDEPPYLIAAKRILSNLV